MIKGWVRTSPQEKKMLKGRVRTSPIRKSRVVFGGQGCGATLVRRLCPTGIRQAGGRAAAGRRLSLWSRYCGFSAYKKWAGCQECRRFGSCCGRAAKFVIETAERGASGGPPPITTPLLPVCARPCPWPDLFSSEDTVCQSTC